jgi:hypothetical protein
MCQSYLIGTTTLTARDDPLVTVDERWTAARALTDVVLSDPR